MPLPSCYFNYCCLMLFDCHVSYVSSVLCFIMHVSLVICFLSCYDAFVQIWLEITIAAGHTEIFIFKALVSTVKSRLPDVQF